MPGLLAVSSCPADLALASVGPETHTLCNLDMSAYYVLTWSNCHFASTEADRAVSCRRSSHLTSREGRGRGLHSHRCNGRCPESPGRIIWGFSLGHSFVCVLPRSGYRLNSILLPFFTTNSPNGLPHLKISLSHGSTYYLHRVFHLSYRRYFF